MADDPYEVLGLTSAASAQQISEAYRALVQIYHPDRYADGPPRVREEALRRMQAVNAAYDTLGKPSAPRSAGPRPASPRRAEPAPRGSRRTATRERPASRPLVSVLYVDGSRHYHQPSVAPLGLDLHADPVRPATGALQCPALDSELGRWFQAQSRSASMADKLMYAAWDEEQRALYSATVGCSEVLLDSVEKFAAPCSECRPQ